MDVTLEGVLLGWFINCLSKTQQLGFSIVVIICVQCPVCFLNDCYNYDSTKVAKFLGN